VRLGVRKDVVAAPLNHDSPDELAQPFGTVHDWRTEGTKPVPGRTMPKLIVIERDYGSIGEKMGALGPLIDTLGTVSKGIVVKPLEQIENLRHANGTVRGGVADGRPKIERAEQVCEAILALSGTTNGKIAQAGFVALARRTGMPLTELVAEKADYRISFADTQVQPRTVMTSHEWSGIEGHDRRYSPFTINVDYHKPWHTLSGRQHFYLDHEWILEIGEGLPVFRPPLVTRDRPAGDAAASVTVRFLTPHSKWSIHSEYQDNLTMLTLFRGGPVVWMSPPDAERIGVADNDWIEAVNTNGVIAARAVVSHRIPAGTVLMYHSQDRHLNVPLTHRDRLRGSSDNALTHISMKPTHMIGGYAQFAYGSTIMGRAERSVTK
jgi:nitrate reductase alpha subunit